MIFAFNKQKCVLLAIALFISHCLHAQQKNYSYLLKCFNRPSGDSFATKIKGIGDVMMHSAVADNLKEAGLTYYAIPSARKSDPSKKLAAIAANLQISNWKRKSETISNDESDSGAVAFVDVRLHLLVENIYMQILVICDGERIYELDIYIDPYNKDTFDKVTAAIKNKECLQ